MNDGKRKISGLLRRNVVAKLSMMRLVQFACYLGSVAVLALSIWRLTRTNLSHWDIVLGVVCTSFVPLVLIGIGLLLPVLIGTETEPTD